MLLLIFVILTYENLYKYISKRQAGVAFLE